MTSQLPIPHALKGISPKAYEHPADRAATAALQSIPMLDAVVHRLIEFGYERAFRQSLLASSIRLGPEQMPEIWSGYERVLATLDMPDTYDLYLTQFPFANAAAIGAGKPMIVVNSAAIGLLDADETRTTLAHEVGHILSQHVLYRTALLILLRVTGVGRLPVLAGLPLLAVRAALLEWSRASELSCDRAATLVNRDPLVTCRTLMVLAGGVGSRTLDLDVFLKQATDYHEWESGWDKVSRLVSELGLTHGYPVRRVAELTAWVRSGDYDRIIGGEYARRGEDVSPRVEAGDAVDFYSDRFRSFFRDAGDNVASAGGRLSEWLRGGG
jgi:Zn-dependent protease with chaperone function